MTPKERQYFDKILRSVESNTDLLACKAFCHHGQTNLYDHNLAVARKAYKMLLFFKVNHKEDIITGALLHDYFLYDWHIKEGRKPFHGLYHPRIALDNAREAMAISPLTADVIKKHMFPLTPLPPKYLGSWLVCLADKMCAVQETFKSLHTLKQFAKGMLKLKP